MTLEYPVYTYVCMYVYKTLRKQPKITTNGSKNLQALITLAELHHCRKDSASRRNAENHRSCSCNCMFAAGKYPENPWRVVMSKDSVGIWRKSEAKPSRVLPSLFRDTRKPATNIVSYVQCSKMRNICRKFFQLTFGCACKITQNNHKVFFGSNFRKKYEAIQMYRKSRCLVVLYSF